MTAGEGKPSKTRRKKAVHALQDLGEALVALSADQLARIELPERLLDAVAEARHITRFEARRRQLQFIGKLMRGVEVDTIRAALEAALAPARSATAAHQRIEAWRDRLLADSGALAELLGEFPESDVRRLRALVSTALRERAEGSPPHSYRALYQALRALIESQ